MTRDEIIIILAKKISNFNIEIQWDDFILILQNLNIKQKNKLLKLINSSNRKQIGNNIIDIINLANKDVVLNDAIKKVNNDIKGNSITLADIEKYLL